MKHILSYCLVMTLAGGIFSVSAQELAPAEIAPETPDTLLVSDPVALYEAMEQPAVNNDIVNLSFVPKVFAGYRKIHGVPALGSKEFYKGLKGISPINGDLYTPTDIVSDPDSLTLAETREISENLALPDTDNGMPDLLEYHRPQWFQNALLQRSAQEDLQYAYMIDNPMAIDYAYWDLPLPPVLLEEDRSFLAFLKKQEVPEVSVDDAVLPEVELRQIHWLHTVNGMLQFSQAYVSPNWYQGGNSYLSLLFGFNWNVQLNQVYHPNLLFQSDLTYKLALTSNPKGSLHRYTLSEDNFQYNLNTGVKAAKNWYYSFNLLFKTQLFNNYEQNEEVRTASFLSPGDLNMGLGMTYNHSNKLNTFQLTLAISPLSYNLKTCIAKNDIIEHEQFNIKPDKKTKSEIGSNVELNIDWKITTNISYKTRLFAFTDYHYVLADWQNTFNFEINKFLSSQIFVNLRYDGSAESYGKWKKFMLREILSFGLSYTFSTKP